jgi:aspartate/methionine/tyrosine aminotransferase
LKTRLNQIRQAPIINLLSQVSIPNNVISLGQGIPFFNPPKEAVNAAKKTLAQPVGYQYTPDQGLLELREVIAEKIKREQQVDIHPQKNVMVTSGANQAFMNIVLTLTSPGDEIIFFTPTYFNYVMATQLADCKPVFISTMESFQPDLTFLKEMISKKTKAIVTISPNNPTGAVYSKETLNAINNLCRDHHLYHISDEVYEYFLYDDAIHSCPLGFDHDLSHTISLFSLSKSFSLSGYRIGYIIFPAHLKDNLLKVQDTIGICAPAPMQAAAVNAIPLGAKYCQSFMNTLEKNRLLVKRMLSSIPFVNLQWTKGAYYFFITVNSSYPSDMIAKRLIEEFGVIVLPGSIFDVQSASFRISYGNLSEEEMNVAMKRLINGLQHII